MPIPRLRLDRTALLVIDVQERLLPTIHQGEAVAHHCTVLLDVARELGMPAVITEQYVKGLGHSVPAIAQRAGPSATVVEKTRFSAATPEVLSGLADLLHHLADAGAGSLVAASSLLDVLFHLSDQLLQAFIRFHGVTLCLRCVRAEYPSRGGWTGRAGEF